MDSTIPAASTPMMTTTTRISISVKPRAPRSPAGLIRAASLGDVPVTDVGINAITAWLSVGPEAEEVVLLAVLAGIRVLIVVAPRVLADPLNVAAGAPVPDRGIVRLARERLQSLLGGRVLGVVQTEHGERGLQALDVRFGFGHPGVVDAPHDGRNDDRRQQPDDDHDHHDLDQREAARTCAQVLSVTLNDVAHARVRAAQPPVKSETGRIITNRGRIPS